MILLSFGKWNNKASRLFEWKRIYVKGYIWTPFCKVARRYPTTKGYWNRVEKVVDLLKAQQQSVVDGYNHGLYNGLELAIATMQERPPEYFHGSVGSEYTVEVPNGFRIDHDFEQTEERIIRDGVSLSKFFMEVTGDPIAGGG